MRKPVLAGNWKMYKTAAETSAFIQTFAPAVANASHVEVVICPPFVNIPAAVEAARGTALEIGGQDLFWLKEGAYTGEISAYPACDDHPTITKLIDYRQFCGIPHQEPAPTPGISEGRSRRSEEDRFGATTSCSSMCARRMNTLGPFG